MAWRIGVDSGSTFTDICLFEEGSGQIAVWPTGMISSDGDAALGSRRSPWRTRDLPVRDGVEPFVNGADSLRAGETVEIVTPGAGGYGPPAERDPAAVERDLADRRIDLVTAATTYPGFRRGSE